MTAFGLKSDSFPDGHAVLVCLFDVGQRPSRHVLRQLEEQSAALQQRGLSLVAIQAAITNDEVFDAWKTGSQLSFPVGSATEPTAGTKWASDAGAMPWLILTDREHRVVAEGFALDELDSKLKQVLP